jgi:splicing factor 45
MEVDPSPDLPSALPSRKGFAARIMNKYGWSAGTGLGASESGITSALSVQVSKRRRRPDAEGGGFAEPGGRGKIIAPKSLQGERAETDRAEEEDGRFGKISQVIVLNGMLENMEDLRKEAEDGLGQEIGEECGEKVFIKFTDGVSALRAVNALDGRVFNGNTIMPGFWDVDKFERGIYA